MAEQELSYVFQPVIHEPLSRPDVTSLDECSPQNPYLQGSEVGMGLDKSGAPLSSNSVAEEEKDALANIEEADKHKIDHPRKAMSLYLKAGKALVLCNQADAALKCFRSLILLATDQLSKVAGEKHKLTKLRRSETSVQGDNNKKDKKKVARTKSFDIPNRGETKTPRMTPRNCNSMSENTLEVNEEIQTETIDQTAEVVQETVQENCCEFVAVEEIQSTMENAEDHVVIIDVDSQEMATPEEVTFCEPVMEVGSQEEIPVFSFTEVTEVGGTEEMTCVSSNDLVCEVNCFETESASLDFEVAMVESLDDSASTHSSVSTEDIIKTVNAEIVMMDCSEMMVLSEEVPTNPQQNALIRRGYVVSELIDTEQNYVRDLGDVIKGYMAALSKEFNVPNEIKGKEKAIFSNIQDIHEWHSSTFFEKLKVCEDDPSQLGHVFSSSESKLEELYMIYCRAKPKSDLLVLPYKNTFFKECRKRCGQRLQLSDYLIKPVQRITKYQLLLRDILKFTERAGEDGSEIQQAMDVALRILKRTNDMIAVAMIQGYDAKPEDTGELLLRETLEIAEGKYRQKVRERAVFLFERLMVVTDPVEKEGGMTELRFQNTIKTHGLGITETVDSDPCKWAIWLRKRGSSEIYVLKAPSQEVKETWMKHIKECSQKKKAPGLLKSLYRSRTFKREESETKEILDTLSPTLDDEDAPKLSFGSRKSSKRKPSKVVSRKKKSKDSGISDRLKENILRFRAEEQMITVEETAEVSYADPPNSLASLSPDSALPQSPEPVDTTVSFIEQRAKIEAEENQLNKVLMLTRLIAARLLQTKDAPESLGFYSDVIASVLPINDLKRRQEIFAARDSLLEHCTEIYENWRAENLFESSDFEERYTSMTSLLSETAGFCSIHKGNPWSVVLYSVCAIAGGREQKWREASQAFYRLSLVYSALQETTCAVGSLLDAHWMSCQAGDYQGAVNFFYNAFIRALACRDLMRCLRFEQQGMFLMDKMTPKDGNNNCNEDVTDDNESRGLVSPQHLTFLINMSRATRRRDWAWFEFAESELALITSNSSGRQANAILSAVFHKLKRLIGESTA